MHSVYGQLTDQNCQPHKHEGYFRYLTLYNTPQCTSFRDPKQLVTELKVIFWKETKTVWASLLSFIFMFCSIVYLLAFIIVVVFSVLFMKKTTTKNRVDCQHSEKKIQNTQQIVLFCPIKKCSL